MLSTNDRLLKLATADARTLARVDAVLTGDDTATATFRDEDCRTVTFTDAAKRLGCSRPMVYALTKAGRLDVVAMNGVRRIRVQSITDFANGKRPPDSATVEKMNANARKRGGERRETLQEIAKG